MTRSNVGLRFERRPVLAALMTTVTLVAIDATITAARSVVSDIGAPNRDSLVATADGTGVVPA